MEAKEGLIQFFYERDGKVILKEKVKVLPEYKKIVDAHKGDTEKLNKTFEYIHFVYSKKSLYFYIELNERKKMVCHDRFENIEIAEKIEKVPEVKAFIAKYNRMQFTENETFLNGVREKISEYLRYWQDTPITKSNASEIQEQLKGAKDLLKVKKEMELEVYEERKLSKIAEESGTKLFEDPD